MKDYFTENQDYKESRRYVNQGGNDDQVSTLSKLDQYPASLK